MADRIKALSKWCWIFSFLILFLFQGIINNRALAQQTNHPFAIDLNFGGGLIGDPNTNTAFQPELGLEFIPGRWGVGLNTGFFSYESDFNPDTYRTGFEEFTAISSEKDNWSSFFVGLGPRFEFGSRLPVQLRGGLDLAFSYNSPPEGRVIFDDPDRTVSETDFVLSEMNAGDNYSTWSAALRPEFQIQYSPGISDRISFNVTTGIQRRLSENEIVYNQRDISEVEFVDNRRLMFFQFQDAPVVERREIPARTNFFANAGIKFKFGGSKAPSIPSSPFADTSPPQIEDTGGEITIDTPGEGEGGGDAPGEGEQEGDEPGDEEGEEEEEEQEKPEELYVGLNGEFEVVNLNITGNGPFSGTGEVFIGWMQSYVAVEFSNITVNPSNNHLTSGQVTSVIDSNAPAYPKAWASAAAQSAVYYTHSEVADLYNFMLQQPFVEYHGSAVTSTVLEAPIGVELNPDSWFAIKEIVFESNQSKFNASIAYETPADWNSSEMVGFAVKDLEFHPQQISFQQGQLEIVDSITVGNANNNISFTFLAPDGSNVGTFIEWDGTGFTQFGIELQSEFTRDWLLPVPDNGTDKVKATVSGTGSAWNDVLLQGNLDKAEFANGGGMTIEANSIYFDMSDTQNPSGIEFPDNYPTQNTTSLWRGFYVENFTLGLPESFETHAGGPPEVGVQNMIIDHQGVTLTAYANNVFQYPNASVADLNASVDTVKVEIETNTFTQAYVKGKVAIPATHPDSLQNPLNYTGLFSAANNTSSGSSFELTIDPDGPIYANMLRGTLTLEPTSLISASVSNNGDKAFNMILNGELNWANVDLNPVSNVNLGLEFANLGFGYNSNSGLSFSLGAWSLASPQKTMHNFPITIQNINYTPVSLQPGQLLAGEIGFNTIFNLGENLGGQAAMGIGFSIEDDSANFKKFSPKYEGLSLDSISVSANMNAVNIDGSLYIENDDPVFGKRIGGSVDAEFTGVGLSVGANAQFGNTDYQNGGQLYRYWQVDVQTDFPDPGIPFLSGLAFRGFAGGAYNNMEVAVSNTGERSFTPLNDMFGFNAGATIATSPEEKGFNADVTLMGEFSTNGGGMTYVGFNGDFGTGSTIQDRRDGKGKVFGNLLVDYVFPTKNFTLAANANINTDPIKTIPGQPFNLTLNINGMASEWSLKAGVPTSTNNVEVLGVNLYEYLMLGNSIPQPNGFTNTFASNYAQHFGYNPNNAHMEGQIDEGMSELGAGFALGLGFEFEASGSREVYYGLLRDWSVGYQAAAGAELHLSFLEYGSCSGFNEWGINGWRAGGGFGFYAALAAKVYGYHRMNGVIDREHTLASLKAGGYITGQFPDPVYATGAVDGSVEVLGIFNVSFHQQFTYGTNCSGSPVQPDLNITPGDATADFAGALVNYIVPNSYYHFPTESPLSVKYTLVPDEQFTVSETQANGTIEMRTFKMEKTVTLEKMVSGGSNQSESLTSTVNNLGEYQYVIQGTPPLVYTGPVGLAPSITGGTSQGTGGQSSGPGAGPVGNQPALTWSPNPSGGGNTVPPYQQAAVPLAPAGGIGGGGGSPNYGNLPPEPPPPENDLEEDTWYKFTVEAVLMELVNGNWVTATDSSGNPITQTKEKSFFTGEPGPLTPVGTGTGISTY